MYACTQLCALNLVNCRLQFDEIPSEKLGFANAWTNEQAECITWDCRNPWTDGFQQGKGVDACLDYIFFKGNGDKHTSEITELMRCEVRCCPYTSSQMTCA